MTRRRAGALTLVAAVLFVTGCSAGLPAANQRATVEALDGELSGELTIFAAASLVGPFGELAATFGAQNPAVTVKPIVFDGSATLATQLTEGASADVFASADTRTMAEVADAGLLAGQSSVFASNTLQIAVQTGNPLDIRSLSDLAQGGILVVLCAPQVPCGAASHTLLSLEGVNLTPVSEEQNVKAVLTKVSAGEADAGLVYTTDVEAAGGAVDGIAVNGAERALNDYVIGIPTSAENPAVGKAFVRWVLSLSGQAILMRFGFGRS